MRWSDCSLCLGLGFFLSFFSISAKAQTASPVSQNQPTTLTVSTKLVVVDLADLSGTSVIGKVLANQMRFLRLGICARYLAKTWRAWSVILIRCVS
jgi:hypothetical protein